MEINMIAQEITKEGVMVEQKGIAGFIKGDVAAPAVGFKSNPTLNEKSKGKIPEVYAI